MATITKSDLAPEGSIEFVYGGESIVIDDSPVKTDSVVVVQAAQLEPWLKVEGEVAVAEVPLPATPSAEDTEAAVEVVADEAEKADEAVKPRFGRQTDTTGDSN